MRRRQSDSYAKECGGSSWVILLGISSASCLAAYILLSPIFFDYKAQIVNVIKSGKNSRAACCRGVENLELWGRVVIWGDKHYANSSQDCCSRCKALCADDGVCQCNSWVFCGDEEKCGIKFGQCWLKKQDDPVVPDVQDSGKHVMWTSGVIYGRDVGVVGIDTKHGTIRIKLRVDCAPFSVAYILELLKLRHCSGCNVYRAEGRGLSWNDNGDLIGQTSTGPPYGLVQGTLAPQTIAFKELPREACPIVQRGNVGWIGSGPDFFISLANHDEWYPKHTVFANVLSEDMHIVEKIASLPTIPSTWNSVKVAVLEEAVPIKIVQTSSPKVAEVAIG